MSRSGLILMQSLKKNSVAVTDSVCCLFIVALQTAFFTKQPLDSLYWQFLFLLGTLLLATKPRIFTNLFRREPRGPDFRFAYNFAIA